MRKADEQPIKLLIVDDDANAKAILEDYLESNFSFKVECVSSGPEAIELIQTYPHRFNVALVDQNLGTRMNGIELVRDLYKLDRLLPVIMYTAQALDERALRAIQQGAYIYTQVRRDGKPRELAFHCLAAVRDRRDRWENLFQKVTPELHSLDQERMLPICASELRRLEYRQVAVYVKVQGWTVDGKDLGGGFRQARSKPYLRRDYATDPEHFDAAIDLSIDSIYSRVLGSDAAVELCFTPGSNQLQLLIPLRFPDYCNLPETTEGKEILGLLVLRMIPFAKLEKPEEDRLATLGEQLSMALQNALTTRQREYQRDTLEGILEINRRILALSSDAIDSALDEFAAAIAGSLDFGRVAISIINEKDGRAEIRGLGGRNVTQDDQQLRERPVLLTEVSKLDHSAFLHGTTYFIPEDSYDFADYNAPILRPEKYDAQPWEWHAQDIVRTIVRNDKGNILGYISAADRISADGKPTLRKRPESNVFKVLELFATQVALAIENAEYQRSNAKYKSRNQALLDVNEDLSRITEHDSLFKRIHAELGKWMFAKYVMIARYHPEINEVEVMYRPSKVDQHVPTRRSAQLGITGHVVRNDERVLLNHDNISSFLIDNGIEPLGKPARSWIGVPLRAEGRVIGAIALQDFKYGYTYKQDDLDWLALLAEPLSNALYRIDLEESVLGKYLQTVNEAGAELIGSTLSKDKLPILERDVLKKACQLTKADYGVIYHYDFPNRRLVPTAHVVIGKRLRSTNWNRFLSVNIEESQCELAALTAKEHKDHHGKVYRYDDAREFNRTNPPTFREARSHISVCLETVSGRTRYLLGVLALESDRVRAFSKVHEPFARILANFVAQAHLRAEQQEESEAELGWGMYNLSTRIVRHRDANDLRTLDNHLGLATEMQEKLQHWMSDAFKHASHIQSIPKNAINSFGPLKLNHFVRQFIIQNERRYRSVNIELQAKLLCRPEHQTVYGNEIALNYFVHSMVSLMSESLDRIVKAGVISTNTSRTDNRTRLSIIASGIPLRHNTTNSNEWDDLREQTGKLVEQMRSLLSFCEADLVEEANDTDSVSVAIQFKDQIEPTSTKTSDEQSDAESTRSISLRLMDGETAARLRTLASAMAGEAALRYATDIHKQADPGKEALQNLHEAIQQSRSMVTSIENNISSKLDTLEVLDVEQAIREFANDTNRLSRGQDVPVIFTALKRRNYGKVQIQANSAGLRNILAVLVDNAQQAVAEFRQKNPDSVKPIELEFECRNRWVLIHVRNWGPKILDHIAARLFEHPLLNHAATNPSRHGMGLRLSKVLVRKYGGTIKLDEGKPGVVFTIRFRRYLG
jgi:GAF domain-containing protein/CheY-like chemotaxis protein/signal transduction histidine kinase